jgi:hypothetical protein
LKQPLSIRKRTREDFNALSQGFSHIAGCLPENAFPEIDKEAVRLSCGGLFVHDEFQYIQLCYDVQ